MTVITRFAPSPTGILHIGGARTALFNWLYARHHGGRFLLRLEDTDRARSTKEAIDAIIDGLGWPGLKWDGDVFHQSARAGRHREIAQELLAEGKAYRCYCTPEELAEMREKARAEGDAMIERARESIEHEKDAALDELRKESVDLALAAAAKLVQNSLDEKKDRELVMGFIDELSSGGEIEA